MPRLIAGLLMLSGLVALPAVQAAEPPKVAPLLSQPLPDMQNKEVIVLTVEYAPGQSSPAHRHNAHAFVYVLEGAVMMGVQGKEPVRVEAGQTFAELPTDVHAVSANASKTEKAKFVVFMIKEKGAPVSVPVS